MISGGRVLIIEDLPNWQGILTRILTAEGLQVEIAASFQDAIDKLENNFYHLAVMDVRLVDWEPDNSQGMTILDLLEQKNLDGAMEKVMISAYGTLAQMRKAFTHHKVADFIAKDDFDRNQFRETVRKIFQDKVQSNFALEIMLEGGVSYEELLVGIEVDGKRLRKDSPELPRAVAETIDLFQKLFHSAGSIVITRLSSKEVRSGTLVVKVQPYYADKHGEPVIVKLGDFQSIDVEYHNFEAYVKGIIGGSRATNVLNRRRTAWLGGIVYSLLGVGLERVEDFNSFYQRRAGEEVLAALTNLFESTCANWYADRGKIQHCRLTQEYCARYGDYAGMEKALKDNFPSLLNQKMLSFREVPAKGLVNPVYASKDKEFARSSYRAVTHGDLNGGNLIIDPNGQTWLIDFATTGKGHILRDVIELESVIKFFLLESKDLGARAAFEEALARVERFSDLDKIIYVPPDEKFAKAFKTVLHLRKIAGKLVHPSEDFSEYHIGLLYVTLSIQRMYDLPKLHRQHALVAAALICEKLGLQA